MAYLFDLLLVALFALCVYVGWRRGFIKTVSGLIALALAVLVSAALSGPIADWAYTSMLEPNISSTLEAQLPAEVLPEAAEIDVALEKLPPFVTDLLAAGEAIDGEVVLSKLGAVANGENIATAITEKVIAPIVLPLLEMLCSVLLFIAVYVIALFVLRLLNVVAKLPVLKQLNGLLGMVAGVITGAVWVLFVARILYVVAGLGWVDWLTPAVLGQTLLVSLVNGLIPAAEASATMA